MLTISAVNVIVVSIFRFTCIFGDMSRAGIPFLKPLSVKLQKRDLDVYEAYTNSNNVTDDLQDIRDNIEDIWTEWFDLAVRLPRQM